MPHPASAVVVRPPPSRVEWIRFAFVYWVVFIGALTPGNISHALDAGVAFDPLREVARLCAVGMLGAAAMPLLLWVGSSAPLSRADRRRNLGAQAGVVVVLSAFLIVLSCFLEAWADGRWKPSLQGVLDQLLADLLLLVVCNALLLGMIQIAPRLFGALPTRRREWARTLTIGDRGRATIVDLDTVEWIEAQGNYQALHTSAGVHLYRVTSARLEALLDPTKFVRIHRRYLVATSMVRSIEPLQSGDAAIILQSGAQLRQSRQFRSALRAALPG